MRVVEKKNQKNTPYKRASLKKKKKGKKKRKKCKVEKGKKE